MKACLLTKKVVHPAPTGFVDLETGAHGGVKGLGEEAEGSKGPEGFLRLCCKSGLAFLLDGL